MSKFRSKVDTKSTGTKKVASELPVASVTDRIRHDVENFISLKAEIKSMQATQKEMEERIRDCVRKQYIDLGFSGEFTKSIYVPGISENTKLTFVQSDRFSVPQDEETISEIKKVTGNKFNTFFKTEETIVIKSDVLKDEKKLDKIATACEKAGLDVGEIFEQSEKIVAQKNLDQKQFQLTRKKFDTFSTLVRQSSAALK